MPTLQVIALTCVRTLGVHDQAYVKTVAQRRRDDHEHTLFNVPNSTDPRRMHDGTSVLLNDAIDFDTHIDIQVWEQDSGADDQIGGSFRIDRAWVGLGEWTQHFYRIHAHYIVTFEVTEHHTRTTDYEFVLQRIHCMDAQQAHDHIFLKINGETVFGPTRMDTGDHPDALAISRSFHRNVIIDLWEEDAGGHGSDFLGTKTLLVQPADLARGLTYRFSNRCAEGDATYEITYDLLD